jgi:hypothetical protein
MTVVRNHEGLRISLSKSSAAARVGAMSRSASTPSPDVLTAEEKAIVARDVHFWTHVNAPDTILGYRKRLDD